MHILIVDDHAFVCAGLKATLLDTLDDIQVTTTERGEEVLSILGREEIGKIDGLRLRIKTNFNRFNNFIRQQNVLII